MLWEWYNPSIIESTAEGESSFNKNYVTDAKEESSGSKTKIVYTINDKAVSNDGTPIDWHAFETTWKINNGKNPAFSPSSTDGYENIASVTKGANDKQAVVEFESTYPWWQGLFGIIAHPALNDPHNYNDYVKKVHPEWGAGPYKVESIDFNRGEATFVPNEKWWGDTPKLDKRIFRQMDTAAAVNAFKNGEIDATAVPSKDRYAAVKDMQGIELRTGRLPKNALLVLNAKSDVLQDIKVREAVSRGLDRKLLSSIWFQGVPYTEDPPGSLINFPFQKNYQDNFSKVATFDAGKAKALLDESGWAEGPDGIREKDGKPLSLRYVLVGEDEQTTSIAKASQKMLKDIGIDLKIETHPSSDFSKLVSSDDYDIFPIGFTASDPFGVTYFGQTYLSDSQLNRSHAGTPELDAKIRELQALPTRDEQNKRANELEVEALARYGVIPQFNGVNIVAVKKGLANYGAYAFANVPVENIGWASE
ncbi:Oligopeptide ABC transporter, periplasmic oligopeptide-binding protein OppA [Corynebacterium pseudotuberculosis]|nr:Oligopeptide ABC transporter, periplasmic oligopeptide-binding protein OppA [Corynebacterium pseudotuberculosis]